MPECKISYLCTFTCDPFSFILSQLPHNWCLFSSMHSVHIYLCISLNYRNNYISICALKGTLDAKFTFTWCFHINCLSIVCGHNHPTMIKIHSLLFLIPKKPKQSQLSSHFDCLSSVTSYCSGPAHDSWRTVPYYHIPALRQLYDVHHFLHARAAVTTTTGAFQTGYIALRRAIRSENNHGRHIEGSF